MESKIYLASSYWRGAMNVSNMRSFPTLQEAIDYIILLGSAKSFASIVFYRIYELSSTSPPICITNNKTIYEQIEKAWGI